MAYYGPERSEYYFLDRIQIFEYFWLKYSNIFSSNIWIFFVRIFEYHFGQTLKYSIEQRGHKACISRIPSSQLCYLCQSCIMLPNSHWGQCRIIRKYQFDYDTSVCLVDKFPEAALPEPAGDNVNQIAFAPGEGKIPENILTTKNWDRDAFPMKHPDGKHNLHHPRERKLTDQY